MKIPRIFLFDLDNTAYEYAPCHRSGLDAARRTAGRSLPAWRRRRVFDAAYAAARAVVKSRVGRSAASHSRLLYFKEMVESRRPGSVEPLARRLDDAYWRAYYRVMRLEPGCLDFLRRLKRSGVKIGCVTNLIAARQLEKIGRLGLAGLVDVLVTSEEAGVEKPDRAIFRLALRKLRGRGCDALMLGDERLDDVRGARRAGIHAIWYSRGHRRAASSAAVRSWHEIASLFENIAAH